MSDTQQSFKNVFACLVHESRECVDDLVHNLRTLDPTSSIILYNGGSDRGLLDGTTVSVLDDPEVLIHPYPRSMQWGCLHDFAVDCIEFALGELHFDTVTIVDSDQLCVRHGYSSFLEQFLKNEINVGLLGSTASDEPMGTPTSPAMSAFREFDRWRPFLRRFSRGTSVFPQWTFWPTTVFTHAAARDLLYLFRHDPELPTYLEGSRIWATEEVLLPSFVALLGYRIVRNPCRYDFVKFRTQFTVEEFERAFTLSDVYWVHPVPRRMDDPLRRYVRRRISG